MFYLVRNHRHKLRHRIILRISSRKIGVYSGFRATHVRLSAHTDHAEYQMNLTYTPLWVASSDDPLKTMTELYCLLFPKLINPQLWTASIWTRSRCLLFPKLINPQLVKQARWYACCCLLFPKLINPQRRHDERARLPVVSYSLN